MLPQYLKPFETSYENLIRLGNKFDGGYVIDKRVIDKTETIIACGLNDEWSFEKAFQNKNKRCEIIAYDHTVDDEFWKNHLKQSLSKIFFLKEINKKRFTKLFKIIDYYFFFKNKNKHFRKKIVKNSINKLSEISINEAIRDKNNVLLKIDIEGDEYNILNDVDKNFDRLNLLIIEFHDLQKNLIKIKEFLENTQMKNIHINANNYGMIDKTGIPQVIEMTLINPKKFEIKNKKVDWKYPLKGLDFKNRERGSEINIEFND